MLFVVAKLGLADLLRMEQGHRLIWQPPRRPATAPVPVLRALASMAYSEAGRRLRRTHALAATLRSDVKSSLRPFALSYGEPGGGTGFGRCCTASEQVRRVQSRTRVELFEYLDQHPSTPEPQRQHVRHNAGRGAGRHSGLRLFGHESACGHRPRARNLRCAGLHSQPSARAVVSISRR